MQQAAAKDGAPADMGGRFRTLEIRLISSLLAGGEVQGVIGNRARENLKVFPSSAYWSALRAWGIRDVDSLDVYFRRQHDYRALARRAAIADDPEARDAPPSTGLDPELWTTPADLLKATTFDLDAVEEGHLSDRIATATKGTIFSWLVSHPPGNWAPYVWEIDNLPDAPEHLRDAVDHARRFSIAIHGAALLYNLLLAARAQRDDLAASYRSDLAEWRSEIQASAALVGWDRAVG